MHHTSITKYSSFAPKCALYALVAIAIGVTALAPLQADAKKHSPAKRQDNVFGTDSPDIIIREDFPSGDRILEVKPEKQDQEECNDYTNRQYPIIIELKPDISSYKK